MLKNPKVQMAIAAAVLLGIIAIVTMAIRGPKNTDLVFTMKPSPVDMTINGEEYTDVNHGDTITMKLGDTAVIVASREGFATENITVDVEPGESNDVVIALQPVTEEAEEFIESQGEGEFEQEMTQMYLDEAEEAHENYPILNDLPQEQDYFSAYQGLSDDTSFEFGIYLYLYPGHEDRGRQDFESWMDSAGYDTGDYLIIEEVQEGQAPVVTSDTPSWQKLVDMKPSDVEVNEKVSASGLNEQELAILFAKTSTTWDTTTDEHHMSSMLRTKPLMTDDLAQYVHMPERMTTTPMWRSAQEMSAKSYTWLTDYDRSEHGDDVSVSAQLCWAWVSDGDDVLVDGPRDLDVRMTPSGDEWIVTDYDYTDPDPFVDNSNTSCLPADSPSQQ